MPIIRRKLDPKTVYPTDIRYNPDTDTVESNVNGDWVDNPAADPRTQTTFPPRLTSDPACDAGQSVADALKAQINSIIVGIDNASTAFTIAGLVLSLFSFGAFAVFISIALFIADQMIAAGSSALEAALTESTWDTLACILNCHFDDNGRLQPGGLEASMTDVNDQIGGLGAVTINSMLELAGEGGVNNLAALGTSTGDCDECGCSDCACDITTWNWFDGATPSDFERHETSCEITASANPHAGSYYIWGINTEADCCFVGIECPVSPAGGYDFIGIIACDYEGSYAWEVENVGWIQLSALPDGDTAFKAFTCRFHAPADHKAVFL